MRFETDVLANAPDALRQGKVDQRKRIRAIWAVAVLIAPVLLLSDSAWGRGTPAAAGLRALGECLVVLAVLGRLWCALYIGGRKNAALIVQGPYSISRNPLYFFSTLGAAGVGLLLGSIVLAFLAAGAIGYILHGAARREAAFLGHRFGQDYADYARRTPLFWPRMPAHPPAGPARFMPRQLWRETRDGLVFLCAIPATEFLNHLRDATGLPALIPIF